MELVSSQLASAAVVSFLIQLLKQSPWFPWLTTETAKLNRLAAILFSGLASAGLHATYNHLSGQLVITGLTLASISAFVWHWIVQFIYTHGWFKATSAPDQLGKLLDAVNTLVKNLPAAAPGAAPVIGK